MRKSMLSIAWLMLLFIMLVACRDEQNLAINNDTMMILESEFSEETIEVLDILDDEIVFYDYKIDESIKSASIDIWKYNESGEWARSGRSFGDLESTDKRIAVRINESSLDIFHIGENGHSRSSYSSVADFSKSTMRTDTRLSNPTPIEAGKEIALWVRLGTDKDFMSTTDNFREADCNAGMAVTITFFEESID